MSLIGFAGNPILLALFLIVGGFGIGAFHPEAAVGVVEAGGTRVANALAIFTFGGMMGLAIGPALSGMLEEREGLRGLAWTLVPGVVLLGDAAGALDPIAGGGMTHALQGAELLARFASRGVAEADSWFPEFERGRAALLRDYATVTRGMLWLARHPGLVPPALGALGSWPTALSHLLGVAGGTRALFEFGPSRRLGGRI